MLTSYSARIEEIKKDLQGKTLGEVERIQGNTRFDYSGVGFSYNLKGRYPKTIEEAMEDTRTPDLDEIEALAQTLR